VRKHAFDQYDLLLKTHRGEQSVPIAADIENNLAAAIIGSGETLPQRRKMRPTSGARNFEKSLKRVCGKRDVFARIGRRALRLKPSCFMFP
jgi:hypothetical protein